VTLRDGFSSAACAQNGLGTENRFFFDMNYLIFIWISETRSMMVLPEIVFEKCT